MGATKILGLVLVVIGVVFFMLALPSITTAISTSNGSALENETASNKVIYNNLSTVVALLPFTLVVIGLAFLFT